MIHSSKQLERELEYAQVNQDYVREKREQLKALRGAPVKKKRNWKWRFYCCGAGVVLVVIVFGVLYYLASNSKIKLPTVPAPTELTKPSGLLPQGQQELKTSLQQGEQLYQETKNTMENAQQTYQKAKEITDKTADFYQKLDDAKKAIGAALGSGSKINSE